jgi:predicted N-acetyltransferase YhbS
MINIRNEHPADYRQVEEITRQAFWNLYKPGAEEHYLVHTMRGHKDYIPELSSVILENDEIIGSIHFTRAKVISPAGEETPIVHFGPVCIKPELHRRGYGRALITHAISNAKANGHRAIVLAGFRYHYEPYGFVGTKRYGISMDDGKFYTSIMVLPLYDGALDGVCGKLKLSGALYPDIDELEAFDATFPPLEKLTLPCQKEFERAAGELDE